MLFNNIKKECFKDADSFLDKNSIVLVGKVKDTEDKLKAYNLTVDDVRYLGGGVFLTKDNYNKYIKIYKECENNFLNKVKNDKKVFKSMLKNELYNYEVINSYDHYLDIEEILNLYKINMYSLSDDYIVLINKTYNDYVESFK